MFVIDNLLFKVHLFHGEVNYLLFYRVKILLEVYSYQIQDLCKIVISYLKGLRYFKLSFSGQKVSQGTSDCFDT